MEDSKLMNLKILCVEDDESIREELVSFLELTVKEVISAKDGEEALKVFKLEKPDMVLSDINMPNMDGVTLSESIKKINNNTPIILMTGSNEPEYILKSIDIGVDKYLVKPIDLEKLDKYIGSLGKSISQAKQLKNKSQLLDEYKLAVDESTIVSKTNTKGIITFVNEEFCKISGYTPEELIGSNHNIVRHPDTPSAAFKEMWATIKRKDTWKGTIKNRKKDGSPYYVKATVVPIINANEEIEEFLAIRQDVTQLIELNLNLEERVQEEVEKNSKKDKELINSLTSFLDASPNPVIVFDGELVQFANSNFLKLLGKEEGELCGKTFNLESVFEQREGFLSALGSMHEDYKNNKVSIKVEQGRRIFYLIESEVFSANGRKLKMYTFNDITVNEYQKLKIQHYSGRLEDFIKKVQKKSRIVYEEKKIEERILEPKAPQEEAVEKEDVPVEKEKRELSKDEFNVLKASRDGKEISAVEYASTEVDSYVLEEIQELDEIENEINDEIENYSESKDVKELQSISERFLKYSSIMNNLFEFRDLSFAISSLAELLGTILPDQLDETKQRKTTMFLTNLLLDLSGWRKTIFVDQTARDIHYLDSSLFSAILQLELVINENQEVSSDDDDDDFELF